MDDLVTRLRDVDEPNALIVRRKAADEIERLEAKLDQLVVGFSLLYHVPRSQACAGAGGRQSGHVHLHVSEPFDRGRIHRDAGQALCGRRGWYERPAEEGEPLCPKCAEIAARPPDQVHGAAGYSEEPHPTAGAFSRRGMYQ